MAVKKIEPGHDVFVHDGEYAVGAVRRVMLNDIVIYVDEVGDFTVSRTAVMDVDSEKVVLNCGKLDAKLRIAIGHAHAREDPEVS
jgi:hypothetical protein